MIVENVRPTFQRSASESPCHWTACRHRAGTSACIREKQQIPSFPCSTGKLRSIRVKAATHRAACLEECPMLTTPCPPFALGTEYHGDSTEDDHSFARVCDNDRLGCRLVSGVHRAAEESRCLDLCKQQGQKRRKDLKAGSKCLACVRVVWEDSDAVRHRPTVFCSWCIVCILVLDILDLCTLSADSAQLRNCPWEQPPG
jgi:hypothetical protein